MTNPFSSGFADLLAAFKRVETKISSEIPNQIKRSSEETALAIKNFVEEKCDGLKATIDNQQEEICLLRQQVSLNSSRSISMGTSVFATPIGSDSSQNSNSIPSDGFQEVYTAEDAVWAVPLDEILQEKIGNVERILLCASSEFNYTVQEIR